MYSQERHCRMVSLDQTGSSNSTNTERHLVQAWPMHDSGTGGSPSLGNFALFPYASCADDSVDGCAFPKKSRAIPWNNGSLKASPGYFGLTLKNGVAVDMTAAQPTNLFRFKFPAIINGSSPVISLDLTDLSDSRQDNASVAIDGTTGRVTGKARFLPSFGSGNYVLYFCADWSSPDGSATLRDNGIWVDSRGSTAVKNMSISRSINGYPLPGGAFQRFEAGGGSGSGAPSTVLARVGVSFISSDQACANAENEIPGFDFNATQTAAVDAWRTKISPIRVSTTGVDPAMVTNFYSGIYRTMVNPQNYTNENPLWSSAEPYFDSFYW